MREKDWIDWSVGEIMAAWPQTIGVFIARGLHCVGCPISPFHTASDAALEHGQDEASLVADLQQAIGSARANLPAARRR